MKKILFFALAIWITTLQAQKIFTPILSNGSNQIKLIKSDIKGFNGILSINNLKAFKVKTRKGSFIRLVAGDMVRDFNEIGNPLMPIYNKLIEIPTGATPSISVINYDSTIINLNTLGLDKPLMPVQPSIPKNKNPEDLPFYYNKKAYQVKAFIKNNPMATLTTLGKMRNVTLGRLSIKPFAYNPATNELVIYTNIHFKVQFNGTNKSKLVSNYKKYYSPVFESLFNNTLLNHKAIKQAISVKDTMSKYPLKMVIISDPQFETALQPFIKWKNQMGIKTILALTNDPNVGDTTTSIHNYLANLYNNATPSDPAPTFVLFVGDIDQIPAFYSTAGYTSKHTDLYYCTMDGNGDFYPEMYYGRWSAENLTELNAYIDKTLEYEKYLFPDDSYLGRAVMVAGVDESNAPTYGNGQINYGCNNYINASHGFTTVHEYLYGSGSPITSDQSFAADSIHANVSNGVGFANYTAHCSPDGWANPSFSQSDIPNLQNQDKYCVMLGNCCQSNKFDVSDAFGEVITHTANKGAVAYLGASQYSLWDEDFWFAVGATSVTSNPDYDSHLGAYDRIFHDHSEPQSEWYATTHQLIFAGNLAVTEAGSNNEQYYWDIYHTMGDPSLLIYMGIPQTLNVSYITPQPVGVSSLTITTEENAYVAISHHGVLLDAQLADNSGNVTLNFTPVSALDTFDIVVTKQFKKPFIGKIVFISSNTPYVVYISNQVNDVTGNNNGLCDYGENILLGVTLKNVGNQDANNVTATLSTNDTYITITDDSLSCGNITAGTQLSFTDAFAFTVNDSIPDQHSAHFSLEITDTNDSIWTYPINITLNAPHLNILQYTINDASGNNNGHLDIGENANLTIINENNGHSTTPTGNCNLTTSYSQISINNPSTSIPTVNANNTYNTTFSLNVASSAQIGDIANMNYQWTATPYSVSAQFSLPIGEIYEDWENDNPFVFNWVNSGNAPWTRDSITKYEGDYSMRSGTITDNQTSTLSIDVNVTNDDTLSFYYKVSSESNYDFLHFYIDGVLRNEWSGEEGWDRAAYFIPNGTHTLTWTYQKDYSASEGEDAAWIDYIVFPPISIVTSYNEIQGNKDATWRIYPNPTPKQLNINYNLLTKSQVTINLYNNKGKFIKTIIPKTNQERGEHSLIINLNNIPAGVYYIEMKTNDDKYVKRIVKE